MLSRLLHATGIRRDRGHAAAGFLPRSGRWRTVRARHLAAHPACAACGGRKKVTVHHIKPFHLAPHCELDPDNLVTLCEHSDHDCHLIFGHLLNFKSFNVNVLPDSARYLAALENRP